ncbi:hypothetical protein XI07_04330 [Bradyrhizobium sp. CCBAU 11445]|nr:hypothetical protein [Bradyrhizobium sp. CCBAU 11445]
MKWHAPFSAAIAQYENQTAKCYGDIVDFAKISLWLCHNLIPCSASVSIRVREKPVRQQRFSENV